MTVTRRSERTLPESILLWFLQVLGAVTAILFGAFGVLSWQLTNDSNRLSSTANAKSDTANLVALVALCAQIGADTNVSGTFHLSTCRHHMSSLATQKDTVGPLFMPCTIQKAMFVRIKKEAEDC